MSDEDTKRLAELEKANAELREKNEALAKAQAEAESASIRAECAAFAEAQVAAGRATPGEKAALTEALVALKSRDDAGMVKLADGEEATDLAKWLQERIAGGPAVIDYSERAGADKGVAPVAPPPAAFKTTEGLPVDGRRMALHQQAVALSAANKIDYVEAVRQIEAAQPVQ